MAPGSSDHNEFTCEAVPCEATRRVWRSMAFLLSCMERMSLLMVRTVKEEGTDGGTEEPSEQVTVILRPGRDGPNDPNNEANTS